MTKTANHLFGFPVRWRTPLAGSVGSAMAPQRLSSLVVARSGEEVVGMDATTGSVQWVRTIVDADSGYVFEVINDTIITDKLHEGASDHLIGIDEHGAIRWDLDLGGKMALFAWQAGSDAITGKVNNANGDALAVVTADGALQTSTLPHGGSVVARTNYGWVLQANSLSRDGVLSSLLYSWDGGTEIHIASDENDDSSDPESLVGDYVALVEGLSPDFSLVCRHQRDLSIRWSQPIPSVPPYGAKIAFRAGRVFAGMGPDASLPTAIDLLTGAILWQGESLMSDCEKITVAGEFVLFTSDETTALYHRDGELIGSVENWLVDNLTVTDDALLLLIGNEAVCLERTMRLSSPVAPSCFTRDFEEEELAFLAAKTPKITSGLEFQRRTSMRGARCNAASVLLADGRVLVAGGATERGARGSMVASCELYESDRDLWRVASRLLTPRQNLAMTTLADGRVIAIGGRLTDRTPLGCVEVFDSARDAWTALPSLSTPVWGASIATVDSDRALLVGGFGLDGPSRHTWWIDLHTGAVTPGPSTNREHAYPALVSLGDGRLMVASLATEIFENEKWRELASRPLGGADAASLAVLSDGSVLLSGGRDAEDEHARADTVVWNDDGYSVPQNFSTGGRHGHQLATIGDDVVAIGGVIGSPGDFVYHWESWSAAEGWRRLRHYDCRWLHTHTQLLDGSILIIGGVLADGDGPDTVASAEVSRVFAAS